MAETAEPTADIALPSGVVVTVPLSADPRGRTARFNNNGFVGLHLSLE